ncbi:glycosyltransferase [Bacillus phage FADO]|uniref:Glycosyltransferase n=1 Tax=Bacillus phage FADO TaxID=2917160 RepID=A0AAE9GA94_9CAUD|nr:glycosyltransferase [Bacillus phage FADO]UNY48796.1 glycosyltransferase [Bacillus phage FADO]
MNPLVSVVIPVYNAEKYLSTCIESVLNQTLRELEVIIVDDGSKDSSKKIIQKYASKDNRIVPIFQENQGVSIARNNALDKAKGDFIVFVDADDRVHEDAYKSMLNAITQYGVDIVFSEVTWEYEDKSKNFIKKFSIDANQPIFRDKIKQVILVDFLYNGSYGGVWNKMFKKSFIEDNNLRFPPNKSLGEDWIFCLEAFTHCNSTYYIDTPYYYYRQVNDGSLMRKYNPHLFESYIESNTLERYSKRWGIFDEKIQLDLARRKCFVAVNGCIQNEFKPDCNSTIKQKMSLISKIVSHPEVQKSVQIALKNENSFPKKIYLNMIKRKSVLGLFLMGKALSLRG